MKAMWNDAVIAESNSTEIVDGNHYFPFDAIKSEYFSGYLFLISLHVPISIYIIFLTNFSNKVCVGNISFKNVTGLLGIIKLIINYPLSEFTINT